MAAVRLHDRRNEVHRRRADETCNKAIGRSVVEIERAALLLDDTVAHDDDMIRHGHCLDLIVGHIDGGRPQPVMQRPDLLAHMHAQRRIEIRQGLVEEECLGMTDDGAAHRNPLALPAGEFARIALHEVGKTGGRRHFGRRLQRLRLFDAAYAQAVGQILLHVIWG